MPGARNTNISSNFWLLPFLSVHTNGPTKVIGPANRLTTHGPWTCGSILFMKPTKFCHSVGKTLTNSKKICQKHINVSKRLRTKDEIKRVVSEVVPWRAMSDDEAAPDNVYQAWRCLEGQSALVAGVFKAIWGSWHPQVTLWIPCGNKSGSMRSMCKTVHFVQFSIVHMFFQHHASRNTYGAPGSMLDDLHLWHWRPSIAGTSCQPPTVEFSPGFSRANSTPSGWSSHFESGMLEMLIHVFRITFVSLKPTSP